MKLRNLAAPLWMGGRRVWSTLGSAVPNVRGFRVLLFHDVPIAHWHALETLIGHVKKVHGLISPVEAAEWIGGAEPERLDIDARRTPCLLAFDDGFVSNFVVAEQLLARYEAKAIFFICPGLMDLPAASQRDGIAANIFDGKCAAADLPTDLRLMNWSEVTALHEMGHTIGAHAMTHHRLPTLSGIQLEHEIVTAGHRIVDAIGSTTEWFAYPFGDVASIDAAALAVISQHFSFCRSGVRGVNTVKTHRLGVCADQIDLAAGRAWSRLVLDEALDSRYREARERLAGLVETVAATVVR